MEPYLNHPRKDFTAFHHHAQVAAALESCLQTCQLLTSVMEANHPTQDQKSVLLKNSQKDLLDWANSNQVVNGTLDHALRKNSDLRNQAVEYLEDLDQKLQSGR